MEILSSPSWRILASELPSSDFTIIPLPKRGSHVRGPARLESLATPLSAFLTTVSSMGDSSRV